MGHEFRVDTLSLGVFVAGIFGIAGIAAWTLLVLYVAWRFLLAVVT